MGREGTALPPQGSCGTNMAHLTGTRVGMLQAPTNMHVCKAHVHVLPPCLQPQAHPGPVPPWECLQIDVRAYMQVMCARVCILAHACPHVFTCVYQVDTHAHAHSCPETPCLLVCSPISAVSALFPFSVPLPTGGQVRMNSSIFQTGNRGAERNRDLPNATQQLQLGPKSPRIPSESDVALQLCRGLPSLLCGARGVQDRGLGSSECPIPICSPFVRTP